MTLGRFRVIACVAGAIGVASFGAATGFGGPDAFTKAEICYHTLRHEAAVAHYEQALSEGLDPRKSELAMYRTAESLVALGRHAEAERMFNMVASSFPHGQLGNRAMGEVARLQVEDRVR